jgi:hypothetical protein
MVQAIRKSVPDGVGKARHAGKGGLELGLDPGITEGRNAFEKLYDASKIRSERLSLSLDW